MSHQRTLPYGFSAMPNTDLIFQGRIGEHAGNRTCTGMSKEDRMSGHPKQHMIENITVRFGGRKRSSGLFGASSISWLPAFDRMLGRRKGISENPRERALSHLLPGWIRMESLLVMANHVTSGGA
eukprot:1154090-Pelagomonas_calceolata.AAC.6